jgi:hypothetical protein
MDSCSPPGHGGEAIGARTAPVNGEAARRRCRLGEWFFLVPLASDSGSWLLLHVEGATMMWFLGLVGDNGGWRWPATRSSAAAESKAEHKQCGRRKKKERGWNPPQCRIRVPRHG